MKKNVKKKITTSWGNASLITSIIALLCFLAPYIGLPLAIFAIIAANQQDKIKANGNAQAGKVMGIIAVVSNGIMVLFMIVFWNLIAASI